VECGVKGTPSDGYADSSLQKEGEEHFNHEIHENARKNPLHDSEIPLPREGVDCGGFPQDGVGVKRKILSFGVVFVSCPTPSLAMLVPPLPKEGD